jgi:cobalt/nickel transport system permease protein
MHISEGFLPLHHAAAWTIASAPFLVWGARRVNNMRDSRYFLAASAGFLFTLTALKLPSVAGSSSHATGIALGTVLVGPAVLPALSLVVLLFQALLIAHGGITTLGANVFSLGVIGPWVTYLVWRGGVRCGLGDRPPLALGTVIGSLSTYACTSLQLALAHPDGDGGVWAAFAKFAAIFSFTQIPVAIVEALFTLAVLRVMAQVPGQRQEALEGWGATR